MAIRRSVAEKSPEVVNAGSEAPVTGPVAVPDASQASQDASSAASTGPGTGPGTGSGTGSGTGRKGHTGPRLSWGLVVNGVPLQRHLIDIARQVSKDKGGYATLADLLAGVKASSIFTDNMNDGVALSDLVNPLNLRNEWTARRDKFTIQFSTKPVDQGGLGLSIPPIGDETEKKWTAKCKALFTDSQWAQMEDAIARPKPQGLDFPKLVGGRRGRRSVGLDMDDI